MSAHVTIDIGSGNALRKLAIYRIMREDNVGRDHDAEYEYEVFIANNPSMQNSRRATFTHRYGDDVTILIAKAGEAIRDKHGTV